ncbi:MAG: tRNA preQ1(34) S-adenosylmethionine ribosyltransferase-isomerase QueA [Candidatus Kerfeldbacteria bacterium]|jgi:S-adenosylmethionine:tRNA ribosyltransferase-isomerase
MKLSLFNYNLSKELIAQESVQPHDLSRLLVYDKATNVIKHDKFINLDKYLEPTDVLVFNDTKVFPARLFGKKETGGKMEVFLLENRESKIWKVLIGGKVKQVGLKIIFNKDLSCEVIKKIYDGIWEVRFNKSKKEVMKIAGQIGQTPTPPYVKKVTKLSEYQTVYAKKTGSVAAPTAGFHFTKRLLKKIKSKGIKFEYVTLHVGYGTFQPVKVQDIEKHKIHSEYAEVDKATLARLYKAKNEGRRIVAVGTTSVRVLEAVLKKNKPSKLNNFKGWLNIFIYPGYKYKFIDAMITNFHLPESTLLMLISAFIGRDQTLAIYKKAVKLKYRFFSFGDGMFIK